MASATGFMIRWIHPDPGGRAVFKLLSAPTLPLPLGEVGRGSGRERVVVWLLSFYVARRPSPAAETATSPGGRGDRSQILTNRTLRNCTTSPEVGMECHEVQIFVVNLLASRKSRGCRPGRSALLRSHPRQSPPPAAAKSLRQRESAGQTRQPLSGSWRECVGCYQ